MIHSLSPCITLLHHLFSRAQWKHPKLEPFDAVSDSEIKEFWKVMLHIHASLQSCSYTKKTIKSRDDMLKFISHCCQARHYSFCVNKCFSESCPICAPPREVHQSLHFLPDPILSDTEEDHYKSFDEVYGESTSEKDRPSAIKKADAGSHRFTLKNVKNADIMLQCEECELWRLVQRHKAHKAAKEFSPGGIGRLCIHLWVINPRPPGGRHHQCLH